MTWSTRPSLPAGHETTAAEMKEILDQIERATSPDHWRLNASTESIINATDQAIAFTTNVSSQGVTVTSLERVTLNRAGRWQLAGSIRWPAAGTAGREHFITIRRYNASNVLQEVLGGSAIASTSTGNAQNHVAGSMICLATDYLELWGFQNSGGNKTPENNPSVASGGTRFEGYWVGDA